MINVVVPMAGAGSRFKTAGYSDPKPFINICGKMMIEHVLDGLQLPNAHYTLIIQKKFLKEYEDKIHHLTMAYRVAFCTVESLTQGASCTALAAFEIINNNLPVIFADSDNFYNNEKFRAFAKDAQERKLDGSLLTFPSENPCFSYATLSDNGLVTKTQEKEVISCHALAGAYFFKRGIDFIRCAIDMMIYGDRVKNEYYMSNAYNHAIRYGARIGIFEIQDDEWECVGTPDLLETYLAKYK